MSTLTIDSAVQRTEALETANRIRTYRKELKQTVRREGRRRVRAVVADPPQEVETMAVFDLLAAMAGWGEGRVNKLLRVSAVPANKTVGGLSERQRRELVARLGA